MASSSRRVTVEFLGDDRSLSRTAMTAESRTSKLGATFAKVGKLAALGLGAGLVVAGVAAVNFVKAAAEDQASAQKLAESLKNSTDATKKQVQAVEDYILKTSLATGVADDELRPAFQRLAEATHNVGDAQKLMSLAMDVSAGTGKSLESVSMALMKAQNGSVSGLSRLGVATKNAKGETLSFTKIQKDLADTFGGQASVKADTFQGKMDRLNVAFNETKETIGYALIPVIANLAEKFLNDVVPALREFADWFAVEIQPKIHEFVVLVKAQIGEAVAYIQAHMDEIKATIADMVDVATTLWNMFGDNILAVVKIQLKSVVQQLKGMFQIIQGIFQVFSGILHGDWSKVWEGLKNIFRGFTTLFLNAVRTFVGTLAQIVLGIGDIVGHAFGKAWDRAVSATLTGLGNVVHWFQTLPTKILRAVGDLSHVLFQAGIDLIQGLVDGIGSMFGTVQGKLGDLTDNLTSWKGPPSRDRTLLTENGRLIMQSLIDGIEGGVPQLKAALEKVTGVAQAAGDKLQAVLQEQTSFQQGFVSSFSTSLFGSDAKGVGGILSFARQQKEDADRLERETRKLSKMGLSDELLQQLASSGPEGIAQIHALAQGATRRQIKHLNALTAGASRSLHGAARSAGTEIYGDDVREARRDKRLADHIAKAFKQAVHDMKDDQVIRVYLDGREIRTTLLRHKRRTGRELGLA